MTHFWFLGGTIVAKMHCCTEMAERLADGTTGVVYVPKFREYGIRVLDGGTSFIVIQFCPWCGVLLPGSLRDEWFDELERRGLSPYGVDIPEEFVSDRWWIERTSDSSSEPSA